MKKYEVQTYTICDGWINCWMHTQDNTSEPQLFNSYYAAKKELKEFLQECEDDYMRGFLNEKINKKDYRIVRVE